MKNFRHIGMLGLFFCLSVCGFADDSTEWVGKWVQAIEMEKAKNYQEGVSLLSEAIAGAKETSIPHSYLYFERAQQFMRMEEFQKAIEDFSVSIDDEKASPEKISEALMERATAHLRIGEKDLFREDMAKAIKIYPLGEFIHATEDYIIMQAATRLRFDPATWDCFVDSVVNQQLAKSKEDVFLSSSGVIFIKLNMDFFRQIAEGMSE